LIERDHELLRQRGNRAMWRPNSHQLFTMKLKWSANTEYRWHMDTLQHSISAKLYIPLINVLNVNV